MNTVSPEFIAALRDVSIFAPELPEAEAYTVLDKLEAYERSIVLPPNVRRSPVRLDYEFGSASRPDELRVFGSPSSAVLLTAEHATCAYKQSLDDLTKATYIGADQGTGGLAAFLAEDNAQSIVPLGRQTANVANAPDSHPLKDKMRELFPRKTGFISLHGMLPGKLTDITDKTEIHAILGLGMAPSELSRSMAESIITKTKDLGLRAVIGNDVSYQIHDPQTNGLKLDQAGQPRTGQLKAYRSEMTTNYAYRLMEAEAVTIPSMQIELARSLRLIAGDAEGGGGPVDKKARAMGVYLGYIFMKSAVELLAENGAHNEDSNTR